MQFADSEDPDKSAHKCLLSAYRINGYCSICRQTENSQIRLHVYAHSSGLSLFAFGIRAFLPCTASYDLGLHCLLGHNCLW